MANLDKTITKNVKINPKMLWKFTKTATKFSETVADIELRGSLDKEKTNALKEPFTSVFTEKNPSDVPTPKQSGNHFP